MFIDPAWPCVADHCVALLGFWPINVLEPAPIKNAAVYPYVIVSSTMTSPEKLLGTAVHVVPVDINWPAEAWPLLLSIAKPLGMAMGAGAVSPATGAMATPTGPISWDDPPLYRPMLVVEA